MPTVKLPRASWDNVIMLLEYWDTPFISALRKEIEDQVYSQEY